MVFVSEDLKTLVGAHDFSTNTYLSTNPDIYMIYEDHPSSHPKNGEIVINNEVLVRSDNMPNHRVEGYRIRVVINYDASDNSSSNILSAFISELQSLFDTENRKILANRELSTKDYFWKLTYDWSGDVRMGSVRVFVDCDKRWII